MIPSIIYNFLLFLVGGSLASFSLLVVERIGIKSILKGRSMCLSCNRAIPWWENIPIISYIMLQGRCKGCRIRIPSGYLLLELFSGILFIFLPSIISNWTYNFTQQILLFIVFSIIFILGIIISFYDLRHKVILEPALYILILITIAINIYTQYYDNHIGINYLNLFSGLIIAVPFIVLFIISAGKWLGLGDIILYIILGTLLPLEYSIYIFLYSVWIGAFVSIVLLLIDRANHNMKTEVAFAPFIFLALLMVFIIKNDVLHIGEIINYLTFLR